MSRNRQFQPLTKWIAIAILVWILVVLLLVTVLRGETLATTVGIFLAAIVTLPTFLQLLANHQDFLPALEELPTFLFDTAGRFLKWLLRKFWPILAVTLLIILLFTVILPNVIFPKLSSFFPPSPRSQVSSCALPANTSTNNNYIDVTPIDGTYVGISEGKFIFDKSAADDAEKEFAANIFRQNTFNNSDLIDAWQEEMLCWCLMVFQ